MMMSLLFDIFALDAITLDTRVVAARRQIAKRRYAGYASATFRLIADTPYATYAFCC